MSKKLNDLSEHVLNDLSDQVYIVTLVPNEESSHIGECMKTRQ